MKIYSGVKLQLYSFLTSALDRGQWSASQPGCFISGERNSSTYSTEWWVGTRANLGALEKI
jgi:hypothetical protein